ncbi:hypothetical protein K505DRAFT_392102 [Melanomma pulvis-pyrius CBS 109.77]|uniref:Uncharacterized protein n=1 Tax=Melanomma pulvis-pyrius CBS 109.77 TaxID=1314802 RepID=A0A6A6WZS0_9PLEO|nr:hypothetical protein K505DRAFT_392102 [Melanomma pulvis-pyrius CBS 109.77]
MKGSSLSPAPRAHDPNSSSTAISVLPLSSTQDGNETTTPTPSHQNSSGPRTVSSDRIIFSNRHKTITWSWDQDDGVVEQVASIILPFREEKVKLWHKCTLREMVNTLLRVYFHRVLGMLGIRVVVHAAEEGKWVLLAYPSRKVPNPILPEWIDTEYVKIQYGDDNGRWSSNETIESR